MISHHDTAAPPEDVPLPAPGCDPALSDLVRWVDRGVGKWRIDGADVPVALTVGGTLMRGAPIPAAAYIELTEDVVVGEMGRDTVWAEEDHTDGRRCILSAYFPTITAGTQITSISRAHSI